MFAASKSGRVAATTDPQFNYVTMLLHGDGTNGAQNNTFIDGSTNNFTITRNGNTTQGSFSPYGSNWGNYFDGTGDYLTSTITAVSNTTITMECWVYNNSLDLVNGNHYVQIDNGANTNYALTQNGSGQARFLSRNNSGTDIFNLNGGTISTNAWTHIVGVTNGSTASLYVNGTRVATTAFTPSTTDGTALTIGRNGPNAQRYVNGYISNVRIVSGTAVYNPTSSSLTVPTATLTAIANTKVLTCQSNRFIDNSSNNFTITPNGDVSVQRFNPFGASTAYSTSVIGGSGYFDGSGDYLTLTDNSSLDLSGDFTIELWHYQIGAAKFYAALFNSTNPYSTTNSYRLSTGNTNNTYEFASGSSGVMTSSTPFISNMWNHVAIVRQGTALKMYQNGVQVASVTNSQSFVADTFYVSESPGTGSPYYYQGFISNLRVVKGTAVYTSNFTPPTAPLTAITNTSLLLNYTNGAIFDNAMMNDLETVGNAQISTSVKKYGTGSLAFDGTGDYLASPASPNNILGTGNFTVECWIYINSLPSVVGGIVDTGTAVIANRFALVLYSSGKVYIDNNSNLLISTSSLSTGIWYHIAAVRSGTGTNQTALYINGIQDKTSTIATDFSSNLCRIGTTIDGYSLNGYIDDLRITKGYARYTANFTPPTAAFFNTGPI